jgi:hypothetical protein
MTYEDVLFLTGPGAQPWLRLAAGERDSLKAAKQVRKELSAERARLVIEQAELRHRATEKFSLAERMFFTRVGLEQATDEAVARYKAARFPAGARVADLCCGTGGDLMPLAERGPVGGVDRDSAIAHIAEVNARLLAASATVEVADASRYSVADFAGWHIDPDRRPEGKRTTHIALHDPGPQVIERLLDENPNGAIKLAPAADVVDATPSRGEPSAGVRWHEAELEWISRKRECRQLVAWFGSLAKHAGMRRATVVLNNIGDPGRVRSETFVGRAGVAVSTAPTIGSYIFEPDCAVLAADLTGALANRYGLHAVSATAAYLTTDAPVVTPLLAAFEVMEVLPYDAKKLSSWLRARGIGAVEVKKRGVEIDPARLQRELSGEGDESATVILCRIQKRVTAIIAKRI